MLKIAQRIEVFESCLHNPAFSRGITWHRCKMGEQATLVLMGILGKTLEHLEQNSDPNDPAIQNLKHSILLIIAEFELIKSEREAA
jgi:hypothetical protein